MANPSDSKPSDSIYLLYLKLIVIYFIFLSYKIDLDIYFIDFVSILDLSNQKTNSSNSSFYCKANPRDSKPLDSI